MYRNVRMKGEAMDPVSSKITNFNALVESEKGAKEVYKNSLNHYSKIENVTRKVQKLADYALGPNFLLFLASLITDSYGLDQYRSIIGLTFTGILSSVTFLEPTANSIRNFIFTKAHKLKDILPDDLEALCQSDRIEDLVASLHEISQNALKLVDKNRIKKLFEDQLGVQLRFVNEKQKRKVIRSCVQCALIKKIASKASVSKEHIEDLKAEYEKKMKRRILNAVKV